MICPRCNAEIDEGSIFCRKCGTRLTGASTPQSEAPSQPGQSVRDAGAQTPAAAGAPDQVPAAASVSAQTPAAAPASIHASATPHAPVAKKSGKVKIAVGVGVIALVVIAIAVGMFFINQPKKEVGDGYEIVYEGITESEQLGSCLSGTVKNTSGEDSETISMSWEVYDKNGAIIGMAIAMVDDVPSGAEKHFEAAFLFNDLDNYGREKEWGSTLVIL